MFCCVKSLTHWLTHLSLPNIPSSCFVCFLSASLGFLGHGATERFWCFGELHEGRLDGWEVSGDLVHAPLAGTDSVWCWEGQQVLLRVWGPASQPDAQLCGGKDGQGEGISLRQQLVLPHPSFHGAHPEDSRWAGLNQRATLPLPGHGLSAGVIDHVHGLTVGEKFGLETTEALT